MIQRLIAAGSVMTVSCGCLLAGLATQAAAQVSAEALFVPHRAFYVMSLGTSQSNANVIDVDGRMVFEWRDDCEGWSVEQRYAINFYDGNGGIRELSTSYKTWEAKSGDAYRFIVSKIGTAPEPENIEGRARRGGDGRISAAFEKPEETTFDMGAETLFPTRHSFDMIDAALQGRTFFGAKMFDGGEVEGATTVTAAMGRVTVPEPGKTAELNGRYWPVRMAFFDDGADDRSAGEPSYEMSVSLHDNGIARALSLDYGDFVVDMTLDKLELLPSAGC